MIDPCPICGQVPEPVKASYEAFTIACCGLFATDPWFISTLLKWRKLVERIKHEMPDLPKGD